MKILKMCFKEIVNCKEDDLAIFLYEEIINYRLEPPLIFSEIIEKTKLLNPNYEYKKDNNKGFF